MKLPQTMCATRACFTGLLVLLGGCSLSNPAPRVDVNSNRPDLVDHSFLVNDLGQPCNPVTFTPFDQDPAQTANFEAHITQMLKAMDTFLSNGDGSAPRKILIFVHGGMNDPADSRANASIALSDILDQHADAYPFFLNWNSGPLSSLGEHLSNPVLTDGNPDFIFSPPAYLFADVGRAISRAPIVWARMGQNDIDAASGAFGSLVHVSEEIGVWQNPHLQPTLLYYYALNQRYRDHPEQAIAVSVGHINVSGADWIRRGAQYFAAVPSKVVTTPLLDALGQGAYDKMLRRAHAMFSNSQPPRERKQTFADIEHDLDHGQSGGIPLFLDALQSYINAHPNPARPFEITLVAHSMGALIADRIVNFYPALPTTHIVYLGAACTIDDFRTGVIPYMLAHPSADFYNLSLHPTAEALDDEATDFVTRGSLLVWIDKFLDEPQTPLNRTLGQWSNILAATYIFPPELRGRITLKAFDMLDPAKISLSTRNDPQVHSALSHIEFWKPSVWKADAPRPENDTLMHFAKTQLPDAPPSPIAK